MRLTAHPTHGAQALLATARQQRERLRQQEVALKQLQEALEPPGLFAKASRAPPPAPSTPPPPPSHLPTHTHARSSLRRWMPTRCGVRSTLPVTRAVVRRRCSRPTRNLPTSPRLAGGNAPSSRHPSSRAAPRAATSPWRLRLPAQAVQPRLLRWARRSRTSGIPASMWARRGTLYLTRRRDNNGLGLECRQSRDQRATRDSLWRACASTTPRHAEEITALSCMCYSFEATGALFDKVFKIRRTPH